MLKVNHNTTLKELKDCRKRTIALIKGLPVALRASKDFTLIQSGLTHIQEAIDELTVHPPAQLKLMAAIDNENKAQEKC